MTLKKLDIQKVYQRKSKVKSHKKQLKNHEKRAERAMNFPVVFVDDLNKFKKIIHDSHRFTTIDRRRKNLNNREKEPRYL